MTLDGFASFDADGNINTYTWWTGEIFDTSSVAVGQQAQTAVIAPLGTTHYGLSVVDTTFQTSTTTTTVLVQDTTAPQLLLPPNVTVECTSRQGQQVPIGTATATDVCDQNPAIMSDSPFTFAPGTTTVTWTATDATGNVANAQQTVTVEDTKPPTLTLIASPASLWPPDGKPVPIHITATTTDACSNTVQLVLLSATVTEPDGRFSVDPEALQGVSIGTADFDFSAIAFRNGTAIAGRVYAFTHAAIDEAGNRTVAAVNVTVQHNQGGSP